MSGRRSRGDGSVFYDETRGRWVAVLELARDPETGRRTRRKASAPTKTAARELLDGMRAEKRKAGTVGKRDVTVGQVLADYVAHPPAGWRSPITRQVNRDHAARITHALGSPRRGWSGSWTAWRRTGTAPARSPAPGRCCAR